MAKAPPQQFPLNSHQPLSAGHEFALDLRGRQKLPVLHHLPSLNASPRAGSRFGSQVDDSPRAEVWVHAHDAESTVVSGAPVARIDWGSEKEEPDELPSKHLAWNPVVDATHAQGQPQQHALAGGGHARDKHAEAQGQMHRHASRHTGARPLRGTAGAIRPGGGDAVQTGHDQYGGADRGGGGGGVRVRGGGGGEERPSAPRTLRRVVNAISEAIPWGSSRGASNTQSTNGSMRSSRLGSGFWSSLKGSTASQRSGRGMYPDSTRSRGGHADSLRSRGGHADSLRGTQNAAFHSETPRVDPGSDIGPLILRPPRARGSPQVRI
uniref:Uncharacterized protein n=1 Tax=Chrysotila carterae TaxID=13221 RepID=A0A7S4ERN6_CHRCT